MVIERDAAGRLAREDCPRSDRARLESQARPSPCRSGGWPQCRTPAGVIAVPTAARQPAGMRLTSRLCAGIAAVAVVVLAPSTTAHAADRGALLNAERIARLSRADTAKQVRALTLPATRVRYGVDAFRLTYATVGVDGTPTTASGLLVLPRTRAHDLR